jgi:hypothetical protein
MAAVQQALSKGKNAQFVVVKALAEAQQTLKDSDAERTSYPRR